MAARLALRGLTPIERGVILTVVVVLGVVLAWRIQDTQNRRKFIEDARSAVQAFDSVASAVEVGVTYADYAKRVADAKAVVDRFLRKWPTDFVPPLRATVAEVMDHYALALEVWGQRIKGENYILDRHELAPRLLAVPSIGTRLERGFTIGSTSVPDSNVIDLEPAQQVIWAHAAAKLKQARDMVR